MTLGKPSRLAVVRLLFSVGCWVLWLALAPSSGAILPDAGRQYGPTTPSGYYVRVQPSTMTMAHSQRPHLTARVADAAGQPIDDVLVSFVPSEGAVTTDTSRTRGGVVTGTFTATTGSDSPRTAFVIVTVENVAVTVFIDIVPAIYGR